MSDLENVEYKVVLVFPGWGEERANAEQIMEEALAYLNTHKQKPGMRFAPNVGAHLEIVPDIEQAQNELDADDSTALVILHDLPEEERDAFTSACAAQGVQVCHTLPVAEESERPRKERDKQRGWQFILKKREDNKPSAHQVPETTLTASLDDDEDVLRERVGQMICVMALGVMSYHWARQPPPTILPD